MVSSSCGSHSGSYHNDKADESRQQESQSRETFCSSADYGLSDNSSVPLYVRLRCSTKSSLTRKRATKTNDSSESFDSSEPSDCDSKSYKRHKNDPKMFHQQNVWMSSKRSH